MRGEGRNSYEAESMHHLVMAMDVLVELVASTFSSIVFDHRRQLSLESLSHRSYAGS